MLHVPIHAASEVGTAGGECRHADTMCLVVLLADTKDVIPRAEKDVQVLGYGSPPQTLVLIPLHMVDDSELCRC